MVHQKLIKKVRFKKVFTKDLRNYCRGNKIKKTKIGYNCKKNKINNTLFNYYLYYSNPMFKELRDAKWFARDQEMV